MSPSKSPINDDDQDLTDAPGAATVKRASSVMRLKQNRTVTNLKKQFDNMKL